MKRSISVFLLASLASLSALSAEAPFSLAGSWMATTADADGEDLESKLVFEKNGDAWSARLNSSLWDGARPVKEVTFDGETLGYAIELEFDGQEITYAVVAKAVDEALKGTWTASDANGNQIAEGPWSAEHVGASSAVVGKWSVTATGAEEGPQLKFKASFAEDEDGDGFVGNLVSLAGKIDMKSVKVEGDQVVFSMDFPYDGEIYGVEVKATADGDEMAGRWTARDDEGEEQATGDWSALREGAVVLAGGWDVSASRPDGTEISATFRFEEKDDAWAGVAVLGDGPEITLEKVNLEGKALVVDLEVPRDGSTVEVRIKAAYEDGQWAGKWLAFDDSGSEAASGKWLAKPSSES